jgi:hypothetical protein
MTRLPFACVLAGLVAAGTSSDSLAQNAPATPPAAPAHVNKFDSTGAGDSSVFAPLDLPAGTEFRSGSGMPGPRYWQNRADYDIRATLDTTADRLTGQLQLRYTNHSPDTLRFLWLQVEQNAFAPSSLNSYVFAEQSRFGGRGFAGGDVIDRFDLVRGPANTAGGARVALHTRTEGTELKADLPEPLAPGATVLLDIAWHFQIPEHGADRMGRDGALFELAQWYPRVAVYDDLRGWNTEPYLGQGEFYLEYGDFTYAVTVPAGYIVAGTGTLDNPREVLTEAERARLAKALVSPTQVAIISAADFTNGVARPRSSGTLTWRFRAHNVRDVAWAAAPDYQWDAAGWHGILAQSFYRPSAASVWQDAADMARTSIEEYSARWYPYPYPQITAVEGPVSGMEYPMLAMEAQNPDKYELYSVVTHEIGHNWFPMIVGSNERVHMWQDEGLNTFINTFSEARRYPERGDQMARAAEERAGEERAESLGVDVPIELQADRVPPQLLGLNSYDKPSVGLQLLRQEILGPDAFDDAFRSYIRRWAFKHPSPADFFRTMNDVSGQRLDWFWREFWLENYHFDQAIDTVVFQQRADTERVIVVYGNRARGVLPILARFTFSDGSTEDYRYPALVWSMNTLHYLRRYQFAGKRLTRVELDPDQRLIDIDRANNVWTAPPAS